MPSRKPDAPAPDLALVVHAARVDVVWAVVLAGKPYELGDSPVIAGRAADCQIRVDDEAVAEHHAELTARTWGVQLRDLGSKAGTWVEGERIVERTLRGGERIVIGAFTFHVAFATRRPTLGAAYAYQWRFED